jgi:hypothetical protein
VLRSRHRTRNFHSFSLETPENFDDLYMRLNNTDTPKSRSLLINAKFRRNDLLGYHSKSIANNQCDDANPRKIPMEPARLLDAQKLLVAFVLVCGLSSGNESLASEDSDYAGPVLDDKYFLIIGGFFPRIDSSVRVDSTSGIRGTALDMEDELGLDSSVASPYLYFRWRFNPVHRVEIEYYELLRDGVSIMQRDFREGNISGGAGVGVRTSFDVRIGRITYGYDIFKDKKKEFGILAGMHVTSGKVKSQFSGDLTIDDVGNVSGAVATEEAGITFPLPHLGAFFAYSFTPKISTQLDLMLFRIEVAGIKGALTEANATVHYQFAKNFGIGTGLKFYRFRLEDTEFSDRDSRFDYDFFGPVLYGSVSF